MEAAKWTIGLFGSGGFSPYHTLHGDFHYREALDVYDAGVSVGRVVSNPFGRGWLKGKPQFRGEFAPFWYARIPRQEVTSIPASPYHEVITIGPYGYHGIGITPLLFRWTLSRPDRIRPYGQLGGGLLWTATKFPQSEGRLVTSNVNFTPQLELGVQIPTRSRRSLDVSARAVHISSAGLGVSNPGVNVNVQLHVGYSWSR